MQDHLFKNLYKRVNDYFFRNRNWFNQHFVLLEKFDRNTNEFYYVELDNLFLERDKEINEVLDFFQSNKAKGDLKDFCHHTSIIYKKFKNNTLKISDFKLISLANYFEKVKNRDDDFVSFKRKLLQLKVNQYKSENTFYFSFPLIGFNTLQGSIHILFNVDDVSLAELKINAIFRNSIVIFTEFYEQIFLEVSPNQIEIDYKKLSLDSQNNFFLQELDYHKYYLSKSLDQDEKKSTSLMDKLIQEIDVGKINDLIIKGEILSALTELENFFIEIDKTGYILILGLKAKFVKLEEDLIKGIISSEDFRIELNKINYSILNLVNKSV